MSESATVISAQTGIHDAIRLDTDAPPAVVFNAGAGVPDLLAYAHGQLCILDEVLGALSRADGDEALPYALRAVLAPAMEAVNLAANVIQGIGTLRGRHAS